MIFYNSLKTIILMISLILIVSAPLSLAEKGIISYKKVTLEDLHQGRVGKGDNIRFQATVCFKDPIWNFLFLSGESYGVYTAPVAGTYELGDLVVVEGMVSIAHGIPIIEAGCFIERVNAAELPPPTRVDLETLQGSENLQTAKLRHAGWSRITGEVLHTVLKDDMTTIHCLAGKQPFSLRIAEHISLTDAWRLAGARVEVDGGLTIVHGIENHLPHVLMLSQDMSHLNVINPAKDLHPFPAKAAKSIHFSEADTNGCFNTFGEVTFSRPTGFFLGDAAGAGYISVDSSARLPVGSNIRVLGNRQEGEEWRARVIELWDTTMQVWPRHLDLQKLCPNSIGQRVRVEGNVSEYQRNPPELVIQQGESFARILLPEPTPKHDYSVEESLDFRTAKNVELMGVVQEFRDGMPVIAVAERDSLKVLDHHWIISRSILVILGILATLCAAIGAFVLVLRRQVRHRTHALSNLTAQLRASYDSVETGLVAIGPDGRILAANDVANRILQSSLKPTDRVDAFMKTWETICDDASPIFEMASAFRSENGETVSCEVALQNNKYGRVRASLSAISRGEEHVGYLWALQDQTQLQTLQADLLQAQKMEAIGTLAGGVAHDFNNLLTGIMGNLELLRLTDEIQEQAEYIDAAEAASMSAGKLVHQMLNMSRKAPLELSVIDPEALVQRLRPLLRHGFDASMSFTYEVDPMTDCVKVDTTHIEQVLLNLCVNARDAMPDGGVITIGVGNTKLNGHPAVAFSVQDTGTGIPPEIRAKIFEPFFTTKDIGKGTGLGLSTSFGVVQRHGGIIDCESEVGVGTTIRIVLPAATREDIEAVHEQIDDGSFEGIESVLVVDDEAVVRAVAVNMLKHYGYKPLEAEDGLDCLAVLERSREEVDVVLLDVTMPGISGHEVLRTIQERYPDLSVIMCSGYDLKRDGLSQPDAFVVKPFRSNGLLRAIRTVLDQPSSERTEKMLA